MDAEAFDASAKMVHVKGTFSVLQPRCYDRSVDKLEVFIVSESAGGGGDKGFTHTHSTSI